MCSDCVQYLTKQFNIVYISPFGCGSHIKYFVFLVSNKDESSGDDDDDDAETKKLRGQLNSE